jgi:hypothetical protein
MSLTAPVWGQSLMLSPVSAAAFGVASMTLTLTSTAGKEPVGLQWEVSYSSPQLGIEGREMTIDAPAKRVGKELTCHGWPPGAGTYVYRCVLVGCSERLSNGPVAVLSFRVRATARPGRTTVRLSNALGASAEGKSITIDASQADVMIRLGNSRFLTYD